MILLDQSRLNRILKRMAYQVIEQSCGHNIDMIGLNERGFAVAQIIKSHITSDSSVQVHQTQLFVDGTAESEKTERVNDILIITDDVIFSGKTMFKALQNLSGLYKYSEVYVAAVIDRGHRKLPVEAGIVGLTVPTKAKEHVDFQLKNKKPYQVLLIKENTSND
ncbi:bifunctional pyr operon transcriptional regulator/uracil phosphoribosyltransferase PyrR [soil metagenome]